MIQKFPTEEIEEFIVEDGSEEDLKGDKSNTHQDIPRRTNSGAGVEILDTYFTKNSYDTTNKGKQLLMLQEKMKEKLNKGA